MPSSSSTAARDVMAPPAAEEKGGGELTARIASAAVLAPLVLVLVYLGPPLFSALVVAVAILLSGEWCRLCGGDRYWPAAILTGVACGTAAAVAAFGAPMWALAVIVMGLVAVPAAARLGGASASAAWLAAGVAYVGLPCVALIVLRGDDSVGRMATFWLLAVVWAMDVGAYVFGRTIGGPRLAPAISPAKTQSGLIGGMFCAAIAGVAAGIWLGQPGQTPPVALLAIAGAALGALSQGGDLLESWVKRRFKAKDSGHLIPGHGGLMDRLDGVLVAAPAMVVFGFVSGGGASL